MSGELCDSEFGEMQDRSSEPLADVGRLVTHSANTRRKTRSRMTTACNACRARRTKCDGRKPACTFCHGRNIVCHYEHNATGHSSRVENELAAINQRLEHITSLLPSSQGQCCNNTPRVSTATATAPGQANDVFTGQEKLPFQLLGTASIMTILGLEPGFSQDLIRLEKAVTLTGTGNTIRLRVIRQQEAIESLAAFSTYVHSWYPVLRPGFSERYFGVITGPLTPCPESCLVLLVTAIGALARQDHALGGVSHDGSDISEHYLDVAMISLPTVLADSSIESVQSLVLLSIYYNCLSRPWQAYQYAMIASFKVQNLLKCMDESDRDGELGEHARRAYWAVLLVESELCAHFDVVDSGIWKYDDELALPDSRRTWQFDVEEGSPESITTPPTRNILAANLHSSDKTHSYFLAEISMRRMLHRCNTAIRRTTEGEIVYAANIALELELQLDDWYGYLPEIVRFHDHDLNMFASATGFPATEALGNFLRVQYYCCKISIYWPAVYQSIRDGTATNTALKHCERFFHAYTLMMPSMVTCIRDCFVNRWTLYSTIFMTSMAVIRAAEVPCLSRGCAVDWERILQCLRLTEGVDRRVIQASPSLTLLDSVLALRLSKIQSLGTRSEEQ